MPVNKTTQGGLENNCLGLSNVRSLVNKLDDFKFSVLNDNYDLVCVTETWLNSTFPDAFLLNGLDCLIMFYFAMIGFLELVVVFVFLLRLILM